MIKINVLRNLTDQRAFDVLQKAVQQFEQDREVKSYGDRHPELGKMFTCQVCGLRHRGTLPCIPVYKKDESGDEMFAVHGMPKGPKRRHRNKRGLQDLERATQLFNEYEPFYGDKDEAGKQALIDAVRELKTKRRVRRKRLLKITKTSRRINRSR